MKILSVETSAVCASAAICEDDRILCEFFNNTKQTHSQTLMLMVKAALDMNKINIKDIDLFAVTAGPGSFTGVRIGISAVKGMAAVHSKPCAAVSALEAAAYNLKGFGGIICAVMDARCEQVYNALFDTSDSDFTRICGDRAISISDLKSELSSYSKNVILCGDGARLCFSRMNEHENVALADEHLIYQRAGAVGLLGLKYFKDNKAVNASQLLPIYLRIPQAERELIKKQQVV